MADLPEDLPLPLERGEPWWYWLGGRPALDFVNTLRERWNRNVETLVTPQDLLRWLQRAGLLGGDPAVEAAHLEEARELREAINLCAIALLEERGCPEDAVALIDRWLAEASVADSLRAESGRPLLRPGTPEDHVRHAIGRVAGDAAEMLGTDQRSRIRICESATCSARFYDNSPSGTRRWCSMRGCGNVAKARRHRSRRPPSRSGTQR